MLTPVEHCFATPEWSQRIGLPAIPHGLLLAVDETGERWTLVTEDVAYLVRIAEPSKTETHIESAYFKCSAPRLAGGLVSPLRSCLKCGALIRSGSYCPRHRPSRFNPKRRVVTQPRAVVARMAVRSFAVGVRRASAESSEHGHQDPPRSSFQTRPDLLTDQGSAAAISPARQNPREERPANYSGGQPTPCDRP